MGLGICELVFLYCTSSVDGMFNIIGQELGESFVKLYIL
jgi:hypothetical protein